MPRLISYAQNFEDIMLWRALGDVAGGFYIDIGAQSPDVDSVSKMFYEQGWRGLHVDAMATYAEQLRQARPDETVIQAAVGSAHGMMSFFQLPGTGLSTTKAEIAKQHQQSGWVVTETLVAAVTLDDLFEQIGERQVHWLKIDVEGAEGEVLAGWRQSPVRPWVVVVESTLPLSQNESHEPWESILLNKGYRCVYFDGLNRFYLALQHEELSEKFNVAPNVFDGIPFSGTASSSFCDVVNERLALAQEAHEQLQRRADQLVIEGERQRAHSEAQRAHGEVQRSELNAKVHESFERLQVLRDEYDALRKRLETRESSEAFWRTTAHEFEQRLLLTYASTSWRITAPLRFFKRVVLALFAGPARILRGLRAVMRRSMLWLIRRALAWPALKILLARVLGRFPSVKGRLRALSVSGGLVAPVVVDRWAADTELQNLSPESLVRLSREGRRVLLRIEHARDRGLI